MSYPNASIVYPGSIPSIYPGIPYPVQSYPTILYSTLPQQYHSIPWWCTPRIPWYTLSCPILSYPTRPCLTSMRVAVLISVDARSRRTPLIRGSCAAVLNAVVHPYRSSSDIPMNDGLGTRLRDAWGTRLFVSFRLIFYFFGQKLMFVFFCLFLILSLMFRFVSRDFSFG